MQLGNSESSFLEVMEYIHSCLGYVRGDVGVKGRSVSWGEWWGRGGVINIVFWVVCGQCFTRDD